MTQHSLTVIENSLQKTNELMQAIQDALILESQHDAYVILRGVLHALRDRMPPESVVKFGAQLSLIVRGIYYDEWHLKTSPLKIRHMDEFLALVDSYVHNPKLTPLASDKIARIFEVLGHHINPEELAKVAKNFPEQIRTTVFPDAILRLLIEA